MHSYFSLVQLQLDWKICFALDDNKIVRNSKSNAKFTKTLIIYFAKLRSTFFQDFLFRKNHPFFEIWVFYAVLLLPYLKELWRERIGVYTQAKKSSLVSGNRLGNFLINHLPARISRMCMRIYIFCGLKIVEAEAFKQSIAFSRKNFFNYLICIQLFYICIAF